MAEHISDATFDSVGLNSDIPVLLDFWAPWCGPCRAVGPIIDELAAEYEGKVRIVKMNVDENPATPTKFGIRAIPTLMLFKNGRAIDQVTGAVNKDAIVNDLQLYGHRGAYELCIPKGDAHDWTGCRVDFFGQSWRGYTAGEEGIGAMGPPDLDKEGRVDPAGQGKPGKGQ